MALPAFFSRVADSLRPVADVDPDALAEKLQGVRLHLDIASPDPSAREAFLLACNLAARLYPVIDFSAGDESTLDEGLARRAQDLICAINPDADVRADDGGGPETGTDTADHSSAADGTNDGARADADEGSLAITLRFGTSIQSVRDGSSSGSGSTCIEVAARDWAIAVDPAAGWDRAHNGTTLEPGHPLAWLATAAFGMAEVFRSAFAAELGERGRRSAQPGGVDLLTGSLIDVSAPAAGSVEGTTNDSPGTVELGEFFLVGAGAIGQAAALALSHLDVSGVMHVIDPETVTLSNLQRYVLTRAEDVGAVKSDLATDALKSDAFVLAGTSPRLEVRPHRGRWGDEEAHLDAEQVAVALDTARDRITVAATTPRHAYNAWTQVADLGWSRHEHFGIEPCLACLYYPTQPRSNDHELIAEAVRQPPLRVLAYLIYNLPIGYPLPSVPAIVEMPALPDAARWTQVALIEDLLADGVIGQAERSAWADKTVGSLYRDGICAGGLLPVGDLPGEALVPLAHQSALAGIMLAAELYWSRSPMLTTRRDKQIEHRYDVLRGFPQVFGRPRQRTSHCLCEDAFFAAHAGTTSREA